MMSKFMRHAESLALRGLSRINGHDREGQGLALYHLCAGLQVYAGKGAEVVPRNPKPEFLHAQRNNVDGVARQVLLNQALRVSDGLIHGLELGVGLCRPFLAVLELRMVLLIGGPCKEFFRGQQERGGGFLDWDPEVSLRYAKLGVLQWRSVLVGYGQRFEEVLDPYFEQVSEDAKVVHREIGIPIFHFGVGRSADANEFGHEI